MSESPLHDAGARVAYGIDLSARALRIVRATRARKGARTESVLTAALPADAEAARNALTSIQAEALAGEAVESVAMPALEVFTRWLQTPFPAAAKARKVLPSLLDIQLPVPLEQCVWTVADEELGAGGRVRLLAAATRLSDARKRIEQARTLGLDPAVLDHEAFALWCELERVRPTDSAQPRVLFHAGDESGLLLIGTGSTLQAVHALRSGPPSGDAAVAAWSVRVRQILRSHALAGPSEFEWVWTGPGAEIAARRDALQKVLHDLPIRFATVDAPASFLAQSLAMRRLHAGPLACNFRRDALAHPFSARRSAGRHRRTLLAAAAAALVICLVNLAWLQALQHRNQQLQEELTRLAREVSGMATVPRGQEAFAVQQALSSRENTDPVQRMFLPSLTAPLSDLVERSHMAEVSIEELELEPGRVSFLGLCKDPDRANQFVASLQMEGYQIIPDLLTDAAGTRVSFSGGQP